MCFLIAFIAKCCHIDIPINNCNNVLYFNIFLFIPGVPTITYSAEGLRPCTDYVAEIQPLYDGSEVEKRTVSFRYIGNLKKCLS